ncbi:MAG TPA: four helix bundle protein [Anaerolineaceae bacterium]|nr:four helix bundle protein [Anaerolineaceae bacterium]
MDEAELKQRTKQFGIRIIRLVETLGYDPTAKVIGMQLLRAGTSVGANYRSACQGKSLPDFITKLSIALEEADEAMYWMEMLVEANIVPANKLESLMREGKEIVAILTASHKTARQNLSKHSINNPSSESKKLKIGNGKWKISST